MVMPGSLVNIYHNTPEIRYFVHVNFSHVLNSIDDNIGGRWIKIYIIFYAILFKTYIMIRILISFRL